MNFDLPADDADSRGSSQADRPRVTASRRRDAELATSPWGLAAERELQIIIEDEMIHASLTAPNQLKSMQPTLPLLKRSRADH